MSMKLTYVITATSEKCETDVLTPASLKIIIIINLQDFSTFVMYDKK